MIKLSKMTMVGIVAASTATLYSMQNGNPVKISVTLMMMSMAAFNVVYTSTGSPWFPMMMYLMFMGGILLMFMLLSSILPNMPSKKNFGSILFLGAIPMIYFTESGTMWIFNTTSSVKSLVSSSMMMGVMLAMMTMYFGVVMSLISTSELPLRTSSNC